MLKAVLLILRRPHNRNKKWDLDKCVFSDTEVAKLIQLPQITLQVNHPSIEKIDNY